MKNYFMHSEGGGAYAPTRVQNPEDIEFIVIDLFCGAGGTSTGFVNAMINQKRIAIVAACVNHDWKAIKSHWENYKDIVHFEEDIRVLDLGPLTALIEAYRILYPHAKIILWASLECTNFSKAKGGQPRDADSRTLADHLDRYVIALKPDYIQIENVVEFMSWGPLDENGKPVSKKSGSDWLKWRKHINNFGYRDQWTELNSADYGAYTSRNRLFGCFAKGDLPIIFPEATHAKKPVNAGLFGAALHKWKAVKDVLDFDDEGLSIFGRKKSLSDKTLERIYAGLIKYVAGGKDSFLIRYNSMSASGDFKHTATDIDVPCPTIAVQNRLGACFIQKHFSGKPEGKVISVNGPAGTVTTSANQSLVQPFFIVQRNSGNPNGRVVSVDGPARTLTATGGNQDIVKTCFLSHYYGTGGQHSSIESPAPVIPTKARTALIWLDRNFTNGGYHSSVEDPAGTIMPVPKINVVTASPFIMTTNQAIASKSVNEPCPTLLASRRHHYLINPSHGGHCTSVEAPCPVIIARQDKAPLYLTEAIPGLLDVNIDSFFSDEDVALLNDWYYYGPQMLKSIRIKIIEFMLMYGIADIKMRMLKVLELLIIQGFPKWFKLFGNQTDQKKFIGNSVVPHVVTSWAEALGGRLRLIRLAA